MRFTGSKKCGAPTWTTKLAETLLVAVGRAGAGPEVVLVERYLKRLRPSPRLIEIPDGHGSPAEIKRREATGLLAVLPARSLVVALDLAGAAPDTEGLVRSLAQWRETGRALAFVIGGAEGLDAAVLARADATLSLGRMTWPHMLVRVMLVEQLYRAQAILAGHPYHRAGRPA